MVDMQAKTGPRICRPHIHGLKGFKGKRAPAWRDHATGGSAIFPLRGMQGGGTPLPRCVFANDQQVFVTNTQSCKARRSHILPKSMQMSKPLLHLGFTILKLVFWVTFQVVNL